MPALLWPRLAILALVIGALLPPVPAADPFAINRRLGRGVNLGNALEAPAEGEWGMRLEASFFRLIKEAGFQSVRIPIRWSAHASESAPYRIAPDFLDRVDWAIGQALTNGLLAVINTHHYEGLYADPDSHRERFLALWSQIAAHHRDRPDSVIFELLNEPHDQLTDERWNALLPEVLKVVRETNPRRAVIVGPGGWNNPERLARLQLPEEDRGLIVTFHYYNPFDFTHQGASWVANPPAVGKRWNASAAERKAITDEFAAAAAWAKAARRPIYLGEFGAYEKADLDSRVRWARAVREEAEKHDMSWAWWEFGAGFGLYDREQKKWRAPLLEALVPAANSTSPK